MNTYEAISILYYTLILTTNVYAQSIPKIGTGHQSKILSLGLSENGKIDVYEIQKYVFTEVPKITNGRQKPNARVENYLLNFHF